MTATLVREPITFPVKMPDRARTLESAMRDLGIEPFSDKTVERYKSVMAWWATPLHTHVIHMLLAIVLFFFVVSGLTFATSLFVGLFRFFFFSTIPGWFLAIIGCSLAAAITCYLIVAATFNWKLLQAKWNLIPLSKYPHSLPEFAQQAVDDLTERFPGVEFRIAVLQLEHQILDPFLVALNPSHPDDRYHLEVWNEPGFSQSK